jgi:uncharacterized protein with ParB-like and HNH nuclease domain
MSFQTPITIHEAIENIEQNRYLLPAIQREFEWPAEKIEWLFDSLMRGYPISSFLFWNVENGKGTNYKFYRFLRIYRDRYNTHNDDANVAGIGNFTAVLDGQQRLTSLYVGLKGSYAYKEKHRHWGNDEWSIPTRRLYLNIKRKLVDKDEEDGRTFEFSFLKDEDTSRSDIYKDEWFRVGKILDLKNFATFTGYVAEKKLGPMELGILARLQEVVFTDRVINFFLEKEQNLDKALNIFIRINSGGKPLDFSDLIMSIAIANWETKDARKEIHHLVDSIQEMGFSISKDFIFKSYLYLFSSDIRFKVTNFTKENAHNFEQDWEQIRDAIRATFELIRSFGYVDYTLASKNAAIPILYYLYHRGVFRDFGTSVVYRKDRETIRKWLHVLMLKRVLGTGGADGTLAQMRRAFTEDVTGGPKIRPDVTAFPAAAINQQIKRDLSVGPEFIDELLVTQKDDRYAFSILALLHPQLDYQNNDFHKDHLHPITEFRDATATRLGIVGDDKTIFLSPEWNNSIVNLQMLDANENKSKQDKSLASWVDFEATSRDRAGILNRCHIPTLASLELKEFASFASKRKAHLAAKLMELLGNSQ